MKLRNILAATALMAVIGTSALAALPNNTLIVGTKACSIEYLFDSASGVVINDWLSSETYSTVWYQLDGMNVAFEDMFTGSTMTAVEMAALPEISYTTNGTIFVKYAAGNGDIIPDMLTGGVDAVSNASGTVMTGLPLAKAQFDITLLADNVAEIAEIVVYKGTTEAFTVAGPFTTTGTTLGDTENEVMTISTTTGVETEFTIKCYTAADVMVGAAKTVGLSWDNGNVIVDVK